MTNILRNTAGKRLSEYLPELIAKAENARLIEDSLKIVLSHKSWLVKQHCELVVKDDTKFFLAYEFCRKRQGIEGDSCNDFFCFIPQGKEICANFVLRSLLGEVFILVPGKEFFKP